MEKSLCDSGEQGQNALENVSELISAAAQYDQFAEQPSLIDYLQQISLFSDVDAYDASVDRVALMTLHSAKGLEFENVFIVGVEQGLLPHERANADEDRDQLEEERRLFFVGITRAKAHLHISCARYRTIRGMEQRTIPSQFLYELGPDFSEITRENEASSDTTQYAIRNTQYDFVTGQLVRHKTFGLGTVKEFINMAENSIVIVEFNSGQSISLMLKYAPLSKV